MSDDVIEYANNDPRLDVSPVAIVDVVQRRGLAKLLNDDIPQKDELALMSMLVSTAQKQQVIETQNKMADNDAAILAEFMRSINPATQRRAAMELNGDDDYYLNKRIVELPEPDIVFDELSTSNEPISYDELMLDE